MAVEYGGNYGRGVPEKLKRKPIPGYEWSESFGRGLDYRPPRLVSIPGYQPPTATPTPATPMTQRTDREPLLEGPARRKKYGKSSLLRSQFLPSDNGGIRETYGS